MVFVKEFGTRQELEDFLQGKLISGNLDATLKLNVAGLTLTWSTPAVTVTFPSTASFANASLHQIALEIENQSTGRAGIRMYGQGLAGRTAYIVLLKDGDVFTGGTAAATLKLTAGTVGATAVVLAKIAEILISPTAGSYLLAYDV